MALLGFVGAAGPAHAASACPTSDACLLVTVVDAQGDVQFRRTLTASTVLGAFDQPGLTDYATRTSSGGTGNQPVPNATSVRTVLQGLLKLPVEAVDEVDVTRIGVNPPGDVVLSGSSGDLLAPGSAGFPFEHNHQPVFFVPGLNEQLGFIRPLRASQPGDVNSPRDVFQTAGTGGAMAMTVHTHGKLLKPKVTTSASKVAPGKPVTLTVTGYDGQQPSGGPQNLTYTWDFSDGSSGPDAATTPHQWARKGKYTVTVTVQQKDGDAAGVGQVAVTVGKSKPRTGGTGGNGTGTGPSNGASGTGTTAGGDPNSPGGTGDSGTTTDPGQAGDLKSGDEPDTGVPVQGVLIDASQLHQVTIKSTPSAAPAAAPSGAPTKVPEDWRWIGGLGVLALLLAGAGRQTRWLAPRLPEPPWRRS